MEVVQTVNGGVEMRMHAPEMRKYSYVADSVEVNYDLYTGGFSVMHLPLTGSRDTHHIERGQTYHHRRKRAVACLRRCGNHQLYQAGEYGERYRLLGPSGAENIYKLLCPLLTTGYDAGLWDGIRRDGQECYPAQTLRFLHCCR